MPQITVEVTQEIIDQAQRQDCYECLIALALSKATGFVWHVWFKDVRIETICSPAPRRTWKMPVSVRDLMNRFDSGELVEPTTFKLPARFADKKYLEYGAGIE